jgi:heme oxygenase
MSKFFFELVSRTDEPRRAFETNAAVQEGVADGLPLDRYRTLLEELYHVVWHFNPVCAAAASRIDDRHRGVRYFLYEHMHEEARHELMVAADLEALGAPRPDLASLTPSVHALSLVACNYYLAERGHPCSALGMLYVLEVISSVYGGPFATAIKERLQLQNNRGVSFINSHADLDVQHMADLRKVLDPIEDPAAREAIVESALLNFHHITRLMEAV